MLLIHLASNHFPMGLSAHLRTVGAGRSAGHRDHPCNCDSDTTRSRSRGPSKSRRLSRCWRLLTTEIRNHVKRGRRRFGRTG
jgi:hypothetical protein